jgi:copper transport protein
VLADDGHTTSGSFFFAVGDEPLDRDAVLEAHEDDEVDESLPPIEAGAKSLLLVGVVGLIGIPTVAALAVGPVFARTNASERRRVDERLARLLAVGAGLTLVGALALGLARSTAMGPLSVETLTRFVGTPLGRAWIVQVGLGVGLAGLAMATVRGLLDRRASLFGTLVGALAVAGTIAWTSHSATTIDRLQGAVVDFTHLVGAGLWVGGLAVLVLVVVPAVRAADERDRPALLARTIGRFSVVALVGVTLAVSTGFVLASWHVPTADGLTDTFYGLVLIAKLLIVAVALLLGGFTRFVLLGRLESSRTPEPADASRPASTDGGTDRDGTASRIARSVRLEVALLVVVLLLSGMLTSAPTAAVAGGDDGPTASIIEYEYDDVLVEVTAFPTAGNDDDSFVLEADEPIVFEVAFLDDGEPIESERPVRLLASDGDREIEVELERTEDGSYATVQPLPDEGEWELRVTGAPEGSYVSEWIDTTVLPADDHERSDADELDQADHDHADHDHADHDRDDADSSSPLQMIFRIGAIATVIVGAVAVVLESVRLRDDETD